MEDTVKITAIIGNGFDIGLLSAIGKRVEGLPTFSNFYSWLEQRHFNPQNLIYSAMARGKEEGHDNWADIEVIIGNALKDFKYSKEVIEDVEIIRQQLSIFINELVGARENVIVSQLVSEKRLGEKTFGSFFAELENLESLPHFNGTWGSHHVSYEWNFINLNYTYLLENYFVFKHDPHPHKTVETNFRTQPFPGDNPAWIPSVALKWKFHHPHGNQNVPTSLLLGTTAVDLRGTTAWNFQKDYIGRLNEDYNNLMSETDLFIIFGTSLGESDKFWWGNVINNLKTHPEKELIIYWYGSEDDRVVEKLIQNSGCQATKESLEAQIQVIYHNPQNPLQRGFQVN
jgi:hypothetical protein